MKRLEIIENKRADFRKKYSSMIFNSYINIFLVLFVLVAGLIYSSSRIEWSLYTFLIIPICFLYAEAATYIAHRWQQHRKVRFQERVFEMHSIWHHGLFSAEAMHVNSLKDMNMVVLPFFIHGMVVFLFYAPVGFLVENFFSADLGWILMFSVTLQLCWYEIVHTIGHVKSPPSLFAMLALHHKNHHSPKLMGRYNFGISTTLFDRVFGTLKSDTSH